MQWRDYGKRPHAGICLHDALEGEGEILNIKGGVWCWVPWLLSIPPLLTNTHVIIKIKIINNKNRQRNTQLCTNKQSL